jgi:pyridinium-3,5-biscarboxylic acid mononucleotide synthase
MDEAALRNLLADVRSGARSPDEAVRALQRLPFADLGYARVDHHRSLRQGLPEAVYGRGKTPSQCAGIVAELLSVPHGGPVVLTIVNDEQAVAAMAANPGSLRTDSTVVWRPAPPRPEQVLIVTAGTADLPVATQCQATLAAFGFKASLVADCGVAGLHRLVDLLDDLADADAVVAIAGMEGALASVIGGLTGAPLIAVPTSAGYGAGLEGVTALLSMLASCAAGLVVVGIDNGFGAACAVARILGPADSQRPLDPT